MSATCEAGRAGRKEVGIISQWRSRSSSCATSAEGPPTYNPVAAKEVGGLTVDVEHVFKRGKVQCQMVEVGSWVGQGPGILRDVPTCSLPLKT